MYPYDPAERRNKILGLWIVLAVGAGLWAGVILTYLWLR
jgi:hypothetical protein